MAQSWTFFFYSSAFEDFQDSHSAFSLVLLITRFLERQQSESISFAQGLEDIDALTGCL